MKNDIELLLHRKGRENKEIDLDAIHQERYQHIDGIIIYANTTTFWQSHCTYCSLLITRSPWAYPLEIHLIVPTKLAETSLSGL